MKKLKISVLALALLMSLSVFSVNASAGFDAELDFDVIYAPMWTNISSFNNVFQVSSSGASMYSRVAAQNCDSVALSVYLKRYVDGSWVTVVHYSVNPTGTVATINQVWPVPSGNSYRMYSYAYVYVGDIVIETASYVSSIIIY